MADKKIVKSKIEKVPKTKPTMSLRGAKRRGNLDSGQTRITKKIATSSKTRLAMTKPTAAKAMVKSSGLNVKVYDVQGKSAGTTVLPKEIFGQKPNKNLLAQAVRVYMANEKPHTAHTKTRGEVHGGGRKPWRQKGTGRARAGSIRSPLWVGGGTTFGPRYTDAKLSLPKKMRHIALIYALSDKAQGGAIYVINGIEKISPKTKVVARLLTKLDVKGNTLLVTSPNQNVKLASRNIPNLQVDIPQNLNAYEVLKNSQLLISKEALLVFK